MPKKVLIVTAKDDLNTIMEYLVFYAGVTIVRVIPLSDSGDSLADII